MYKIENGIEIPNKHKWRNRKPFSKGPSKYDFAKDMKVMDSVFCPTWQEVYGIGAALKRFGFRGLSRSITGGFRIWRVE